MTKTSFIAAIAVLFATATGTTVQAAPPVNMSPALMAGSPVKAQNVRCNCGYRFRHRHRIVRVVPDAYVPVYPGPPVGFTLRKLFDAGYF